MSIAWVFPGQGSQKLGMADSLLSLDGAFERFELASKVLDRDLLDICKGDFNDDQKTLYFGLGKSKKLAEQNAASNLVKSLKI